MFGAAASRVHNFSPIERLFTPLTHLSGMGVRVASLSAVMACVLLLVGCAANRLAEPRARWRAEAEAACIASGEVRASPYVQSAGSVGGKACGMDRPLKVSGLLGGRVAVTPTATINCPLTAALDRWVKTSVQPAAYRSFGEPVVGIRQIASYGCRGRNGRRSGPLSEHSFGNALDVAGFRLASGREVTVLQGWWRGGQRDRAFLQQVFAGACAEFYTVLGPGSDSHHANHFHLDLLRTNAGGGRHYCRPQPSPGAYARAPMASLPAENVGAVPRTPLSLVDKGRQNF